MKQKLLEILRLLAEIEQYEQPANVVEFTGKYM